MAEAIRLREAIDQYLERRKPKVAAATWANDRSLITRFRDHVGGNPWMKQVSPAMIEEFMYVKLKPGVQESTFNNAVSRLTCFVGYAQRQGWVVSDLMAEVSYETVPETQRRRFTATEMCRLCAAPQEPQEKILIALACNTALRISDITKLRLGAVDSRGEIDPATPTVDLDKGWLQVKIHKTKRLDLLPITLELDAALREWLTIYPTSIGRPLEPGMMLVPSKSSNTFGLERGYFYRPFNQIGRPDNIYRRAVDAAGLPFSKGDGFHTCRRSFARLFYDELCAIGHPDPIRPVQAMLHHKSPEQTYHYIGVDRHRQERDLELRGRTFLSRLAADQTNVVELRRADTDL